MPNNPVPEPRRCSELFGVRVCFATVLHSWNFRSERASERDEEKNLFFNPAHARWTKYRIPRIPSPLIHPITIIHIYSTIFNQWINLHDQMVTEIQLPRFADVCQYTMQQGVIQTYKRIANLTEALWTNTAPLSCLIVLFLLGKILHWCLCN